MFWRKKKEISITNEIKVESLRQEIEGVFSSFRIMHDKLIEVNAQLEEVVNSETNRIIQIEKNREKALDELQANQKLQEKLADFIK